MADDTIESLQAEVRRLNKALESADAALTDVKASHKTELDAANAEAGRRRHAYNEEKGRANQLAGQVEALTREHAEALESQRIDLTGKATAAERERDEARVKAIERTQQAALRIAAKDAGLIDMDAIRLLDTKALKTSDEGEVENAGEVFEAMKRAKPYLFGQPSTSSPTPPPQKDPNGAPKLAKDMTPEERAAGARALGITARIS